MQLVENVSQIHYKGFVVASLCTQHPVIIHRSDCVQPFWDVSPITSEAKGPNETLKMNIFYLGLMIWRLVENSPNAQQPGMYKRRM